MNTAIDCLPCFIRQAIDAARFAHADDAVQEKLLREVLLTAAGMDYSQTPVAMAQRIHRVLRGLTGVSDPYREIKDRHNTLALAMLPEIRNACMHADDPLLYALRMAIAGNVIDLGASSGIGDDAIRQSILQVFSEPFEADMDAFRRALSSAGDVLYITDNAGEIVFDRLLLEQLPVRRVVVAVRGHAVLNDATMADAESAGLVGPYMVISNGSDAPGTLLDDCSEEFRLFFASAGMVIAKGQGNYESLSGQSNKVWFLLKIKCPVLARATGLPLGTHAVLSAAPSRDGIDERKGE